MIGGWTVELRLPASALNMGALFEGRSVRFNLGLNDDDDGVDRDVWLVFGAGAAFTPNRTD